MSRPLIRRVEAKNFKSIGSCDVSLGPLTFLVGANGSGKSTFLDVIAFARDSARLGVTEAVQMRGGLQRVRSAFAEQHDPIEVALELYSTRYGWCRYQIGLGGSAESLFFDHEEIIQVGLDSPLNKGELRRSSEDGQWRFHGGEKSGADWGVSAIPPNGRLGCLNDLVGYIIYDLDAKSLTQYQATDNDWKLNENGSNAAPVFDALPESHKSAIVEALSDAVASRTYPVVESIHGSSFLFFDNKISRRTHVTFAADQCSSGTLRMFALLVALYQSYERGPMMIGVEEPETHVESAALIAILRAFMDVSRQRQVIATTHSTDLLDVEDLLPSEVLYVAREEGRTMIGEIDEVSRGEVQRGTFSIGKLLRMRSLGLEGKISQRSLWLSGLEELP